MIGCTAQTLLNQVICDETDRDVRYEVSADDRERIEALEREDKDLRRANEILKASNAFFVQAKPGRRFKS